MKTSVEASDFVLRVVSGRDAGQVLALDQTPRTVGRLPSADLHTTEHAASRIHFQITWNREEQCHQVTCHGRNGMVIDGKLLREGEAAARALQPGAAIAIGATQFVYERMTDRGTVVGA